MQLINGSLKVDNYIFLNFIKFLFKVKLKSYQLVRCINKCKFLSKNGKKWLFKI